MAFELPWASRASEVLHEEHWSEDGRAYVHRTNVLFDAALALEVGDARVALGAAHRRVDQVLYPRGLRRIDDRDSFAGLAVCASGTVGRLDAERAVNALHGAPQGDRVIKVAVNHGRPKGGERCGRRLAGVACQRLHGEPARSELSHYGAALTARRAQHQNGLVVVR